MFNWLQNALIKSLLRHVLSGVGVWFVQKGYSDSNGWEQLIAAFVTIGSFVHSVWDKREQLSADVKVTVANITKTGTLIVAAVGLGACTGCSTVQAVNNTDVSGFNAEASVPIPGTGGSSYFLMVRLQGGNIKGNQIITPVSSNVLHSASIAINQSDYGSGTVSGSANTNANAGVTAGNRSHNILTIGSAQASASQTNGLSVTTSNP